VPDEDRPRFTVGDAVLATLGTFLISNVAAIVVVAQAGYDLGDDVPIPVLLAAQVPLWACLFGFPLWASRRRGSGSLTRDLGLAMRWRDVPLGLAVGLATQIGVLVFVPLYHLLGIDQDKVGEAAEELADRADDPLAVVLLVVMAVVGAAVLEELFYRGLWLRALERRLPPWAAIGITAAVFALMHFQPYDFLPLMTFGVVAGVLAHRAGRLGPAIWAHFGFNAIALTFLLTG
jgi:uncharacterized protein